MNYRDLSDEEIVELIMEHLEEDNKVNTDFVNIECVNQKPILSGRVSNDKELQLIDEIMNDVLEIHAYENNIWVDDTLAFDNVDDLEDDDVSLDEDDDLDEEDPLDEDDEDEE